MTSSGDLINGRYRLDRELARGGMASVWAAADEALGRRVAIKIIHPQLATDPEFLERFRREARAAAGLSHPNLVSVFDAGESAADHTPFLVMELVEGETLKDRIRRAAPLAEAEVRSTGAAVASALEYAHQHGVIHRDVKPQNILIGRDGRPRLTDFGIAQALAAAGLTRTGAIMGSVHYLAPELVRGQPATPASDEYGLAAVLYEMATGRVPFTGETDMAVALAHVERTPVPPRQLNSAISPDLDRIILRGLAKDPRERFRSAAEMQAALQGVRVPPPRAAAGATVPIAAAAAEQTRVLPAARSAARQRVTAPAAPASRAGAGGFLALILLLAALLAVLGFAFFGLGSLLSGGAASSGGTPAPVAAAASPTPTKTPAPPTATPPPTSTPAPTATAQPTPSPTPAPPTSTPKPAATPTPTAPPPTATPQPVVVPNVLGAKLPDAQKKLQAAGLRPAVTTANVNADPDSVVQESPDPGAPVPPGSTVTLTVATGMVPVPDVAGQPQDTALRTLYDQGFKVPTVRKQRSGSVPAGAAIGTQPAAGTVLPRGSNVNLYVSEGG